MAGVELTEDWLLRNRLHREEERLHHSDGAYLSVCQRKGTGTTGFPTRNQLLCKALLKRDNIEFGVASGSSSTVIATAWACADAETGEKINTERAASRQVYLSIREGYLSGSDLICRNASIRTLWWPNSVSGRKLAVRWQGRHYQLFHGLGLTHC